MGWRATLLCDNSAACPDGIVNTNLSNELKGQVVSYHSHSTFKRIWFLQDVNLLLSCEIADINTLVFYAAHEEVVQPYSICVIMNQGLIGRGGKILTKGTAFGTDTIIDNDDLIDRPLTVSITFAELFVLPRDELLKVVSKHPEEATQVVTRVPVRTTTRKQT